ncbi:Protein of unknown function [Jatrophihabitans endophyticus]|uniref:DUF4012 domain-containing protein n=1 Tax=Jatrophihabitans endophyticus TaxID=1206085 RepID=A0A1M5IMW2_9ACTN|nr:DUF4012 domain-containing protein [Jatrophihabitans endophyticus]SHG29389.1 Protein of unknown function [Jatrophihabitans endophyticus]
MTTPAEPEPGADPFDGPEWATSRQPDVVDGADGTARSSRHRRRVSRRRLRRRRRWGVVLITLGGLVVLTGLWIVVTGLLARGELNSARGDVATLREQIAQGDLAGARATARTLSHHADRAHGLTTGPFWAAAAAVPGDGNPVRTIRELTDQIDTLGDDVLPRLVDASTRLDPQRLRRPDGSIDLARITAVAPVLDDARGAVDHATAEVAARPARTWFGVVDAARAQLLAQLRQLGATVRSADLAARIAPPMLGADGVKRYFVAFQNDAEARGTGGIPGAFAILRVDHGRFSFERFESDDRLGEIPTGLDFGPDYADLFDGARTTSLYGNSNLSPHFPYAAQVWIAMWRKASGERLDGAFALDPTALSYLLQVTGPAPLKDGSQLTAANVVALTQSDVYARFPASSDQTARKRYLLDVAAAASRRLLDSRASETALLRAAGQAVGERRILAYSTDAAVEADLARTAAGGIVPRTTAPYVGLSIVNEGGNKLDYYLDRAITWRADGCRPRRAATATVTLRNDAPARGLSSYVTSRSDRHGPGVRPGDQRLLVSYYATQGAQLSSVTVDGKPATASAGHDLGHSVYTVDLELPRGTTRTVVLHLDEPRGAGAPVVLRQPGVRPLQVDVAAPDCG